jgi:hypothetical protein
MQQQRLDMTRHGDFRQMVTLTVVIDQSVQNLGASH